MAADYIYVSTEQLLPNERYALTGLRKIAAGLKDNAPEELNEFIGTYLPDFNSDVPNLR